MLWACFIYTHTYKIYHLFKTHIYTHRGSYCNIKKKRVKNTDIYASLSYRMKFYNVSSNTRKLEELGLISVHYKILKGTDKDKIGFMSM